MIVYVNAVLYTLWFYVYFYRHFYTAIFIK